MLGPRGASLMLAGALLGCSRPADSTTQPEQPAGGSQPADGSEDPPVPTGACGTAGLRFTDYDWIPTDGRLATSILRDDPPALEAALASLASELDAEGAAALPIRARLDYQNLALQLRGLERVLARLELAPGELVGLHGPRGDVVWLWPSDCPLALLATRLLDHFGVMLRVDFERPGVRVGAGSPKFPFDVVVMSERLVALAPLGRGAQVGAWLSAPRTGEDSPGNALATIEPAPIRSVLRGPALLGDPDRASSSSAQLELRVTASTLEIHESDPPP